LGRLPDIRIRTACESFFAERLDVMPASTEFNRDL
jgi:hypothetical protein